MLLKYFPTSIALREYKNEVFPRFSGSPPLFHTSRHQATALRDPNNTNHSSLLVATARPTKWYLVFINFIYWPEGLPFRPVAENWPECPRSVIKGVVTGLIRLNRKLA